jgi:hypothetical protein
MSAVIPSCAVARAWLQRHRRTAALVAASLATVVALALLVSQCGGDDETPRFTGAPKEAVATVMQFEAALRARDWPGICTKLYSGAARRAAGGARCPTELAQSAAGLRDPRVEIRSIVVRGARVSVTVDASVNGRPPVRDTIELVREGGRFKILSAGGTGEG